MTNQLQLIGDDLLASQSSGNSNEWLAVGTTRVMSPKPNRGLLLGYQCVCTTCRQPTLEPTVCAGYSIERQRIPIGKWGSSNSFKKKHLERITDKVIKKWSDENITNFIQSIK